MVHHEVLGLPPRGLAVNRAGNSGRLALYLTGVLLEETVVAVIACELHLLVLINLACVEYNFSNVLRALDDALYRRALPGYFRQRVCLATTGK